MYFHQRSDRPRQEQGKQPGQRPQWLPPDAPKIVSASTAAADDRDKLSLHKFVTNF